MDAQAIGQLALLSRKQKQKYHQEKLLYTCLNFQLIKHKTAIFKTRWNFGIWAFLSDHTIFVISCWRQPATGVISSLQDLCYICYGNQCQNQTKINCIKSYLIFNVKWTIGISWDGQDGASWDNVGQCAGMLA